MKTFYFEFCLVVTRVPCNNFTDLESIESSSGFYRDIYLVPPFEHVIEAARYCSVFIVYFISIFLYVRILQKFCAIAVNAREIIVNY